MPRDAVHQTICPTCPFCACGKHGATCNPLGMSRRELGTHLAAFKLGDRHEADVDLGLCQQAGDGCNDTGLVPLSAEQHCALERQVHINKPMRIKYGLPSLTVPATDTRCRWSSAAENLQKKFIIQGNMSRLEMSWSPVGCLETACRGLVHLTGPAREYYQMPLLHQKLRTLSQTHSKNHEGDCPAAKELWQLQLHQALTTSVPRAC